jgi:RNA polymerase sigma-B factor
MGRTTTRWAPTDVIHADDRQVDAWFAELPDTGARERLAMRFQPLVVYLSQRFAGRGENLDDLVQTANVGLLSAIDRFDTTRGVRFSTFAAATIIGELKRHFRDRRWALRVPRRLQDTAVRIKQGLPHLTQQLGRSPTVAELAAHLNVADEEILEAMEASQAYATSSLDAPTREDGGSPVDVLGDDDGHYELLERWASVAPAIRQLPPRDKKILYLRFFAGLTQSEIAREVDLSQMQISRILSQTLERLRVSATDDEVFIDEAVSRA